MVLKEIQVGGKLDAGKRLCYTSQAGRPSSTAGGACGT